MTQINIFFKFLILICRFSYIDAEATHDLLDKLTEEFLAIFDKCPSKLKNKIRDITQASLSILFLLKYPRLVVQYIKHMIGVEASAASRCAVNCVSCLTLARP